MLAVENLSTLFKGNSYRFPGHQELPGLNGLFLAGTRAHADVPTLFDHHVQKGYIDQYVNYEMQYQPPEVQAVLQEIQAIPEPGQRTERLFGLLQELSAVYAYPTPQWVKTSMPMYQIMVDRFCNPNLWSEDPQIRQTAQNKWQQLQNHQDRDFADNENFAGGTISGIRTNIDYLRSFAGGLYLNPIFESDTVHGYNTSDYFSVNHRFAGFSDDEYDQADDQRRTEMKQEGIKQFDQLTDDIPVVLDIAVNHTGLAQQAFQDIEMHGDKSKYVNWYQGMQFDVDGKLANWKGWWGHKALPELNHHCPEVQKHFLGEGYLVGVPLEEQTEDWRTWIASIKDANTRAGVIEDPQLLEEAQRQLGVIGFWSAVMSGEKPEGGKKNGGWRLDVPNDINRPEFWKEFRSLVKTIDPELWIVGEIWDNENEAPWLNGDKFDGVMNYRFWQWTLDYLVGDTPLRRQHMSGERACGADADQFADRVNWFVARHPKQVVGAMMNNAGTHDVIRIRDLLGNREVDEDKTALGFTILMTLPGNPSIWSGDELGMDNSGCPIVTDPMNRKPLNWELTSSEPVVAGNGLLAHVQKLATLREQSTAVQSANIRFIPTGNPDLLAYVRTSDEEANFESEVLVVVNRNGSPVEIDRDTFASLQTPVKEYMSTKPGISYNDRGVIIPGNCGVVYTSSA